MKYDECWRFYCLCRCTETDCTQSPTDRAVLFSFFYILICAYSKEEGLWWVFHKHSLSDVNSILTVKPLLRKYTYVSHTQTGIGLLSVCTCVHDQFAVVKQSRSGRSEHAAHRTHNATSHSRQRASLVFSFTILSIATTALFTSLTLVQGESVYLRTWPFRMCTPRCTHTLCPHTSAFPWFKCHSQFGIFWMFAVSTSTGVESICLANKYGSSLSSGRCYTYMYDDVAEHIYAKTKGIFVCQACVFCLCRHPFFSHINLLLALSIIWRTYWLELRFDSRWSSTVYPHWTLYLRQIKQLTNNV